MEQSMTQTLTIHDFQTRQNFGYGNTVRIMCWSWVINQKRRVNGSRGPYRYKFALEVEDGWKPVFASNGVEIKKGEEYLCVQRAVEDMISTEFARDDTDHTLFHYLKGDETYLYPAGFTMTMQYKHRGGQKYLYIDHTYDELTIGLSR